VKRKNGLRVVRCGLRVFRSPLATRYSLLAIRQSLPFLGLTGGSCSCTTEDFLNEFGCSGEQPSSFILHDRNFEQIRRQKRKFFWRFTHYAHILSVPFMA
jgi:hypothetical protein